MNDDYQPFEVIVKAMTARAVLVVIDSKDHWVPQSVIFEDDLAELGIGVIAEINIATWFADKEGL